MPMYAATFSREAKTCITERLLYLKAAVLCLTAIFIRVLKYLWIFVYFYVFSDSKEKRKFLECSTAKANKFLTSNDFYGNKSGSAKLNGTFV